MVQLTKTDFIQYLNCPKSLWVMKNEPDNYPDGEFSSFLQKLTREGYEVEGYVRKYFDETVTTDIDFQSIFDNGDGFFARADVLETTEEGDVILYEIKSSTRVKTSGSHNHLKDICFQGICGAKAGVIIDKFVLVHLNGTYEKAGAIIPSELLVFEDVTEKVIEITSETETEMEEALQLLEQSEINKEGCSCKFKSRAHHCDTFDYFNRGITKPSIYSLPRLSEKKRRDLIADDIFQLKDVPEDYELSDIQTGVLLSAHQSKPQIDLGAIRGFLEAYEFPLYFFDYETFGSAVPLIDGISPHKHFPVQYSLHILDEDGTLSHKEFLQKEPQLPRNLVEQMVQNFGSVGSVVSWHASFEKTQNKEMAKWFPDKAGFLNDLNDRMVDLEDVFKKSYVDARFEGSTSIKKVLPILCPHLGYDHLAVQDGATAMDAWQKMVDASGDDLVAKAQELLDYCKLDTLAMVEIYRFLEKVLDS